MCRVHDPSIGRLSDIARAPALHLTRPLRSIPHIGLAVRRPDLRAPGGRGVRSRSPIGRAGVFRCARASSECRMSAASGTFLRLTCAIVVALVMARA